LYRRLESPSNKTTPIYFHSFVMMLFFLPGARCIFTHLTSIRPSRAVLGGIDLLSSERSSIMDISKHIEAVRSYGVLIGDVSDASAEERAEAAAHRNEYGEEYMPKRRYGPEKAALLLRFMHEVHGIPLCQASQSVIKMIERQDDMSLNGSDPGAVATDLLQATGNIFVAAATASLYAEAAKGSAFEQSWQDV
jgi:hypothetical protein